ncbi:hypothetical protein MRBLWH7_001650 [Microbacterium sp. LWH7-1.2]|uniref:hypothetical protein n=1 Tax=Microbacterium sp. LWH7-1.2 TaxID=3135257 RepID=UPI0031395082
MLLLVEDLRRRAAVEDLPVDVLDRSVELAEGVGLVQAEIDIVRMDASPGHRDLQPDDTESDLAEPDSADALARQLCAPVGEVEDATSARDAVSRSARDHEHFAPEPLRPVEVVLIRASDEPLAERGVGDRDRLLERGSSGDV